MADDKWISKDLQRNGESFVDERGKKIEPTLEELRAIDLLERLEEIREELAELFTEGRMASMTIWEDHINTSIVKYQKGSKAETLAHVWSDPGRPGFTIVRL